MNNAQIAECFEEMAILLELAGENPFRVRAYQRAAQTVAGLSRPLKDIENKDLLEVPGIGKGIADHIGELMRTGALGELEVLRKRFPPGLLEMIRVPGLGPKRAKVLFEKLKIHSLDALREAARSGRLQTLPGFGAKLEENILRGLSFAQEAKQRALYWDGRTAMEELLAAMRRAPGVVDLAAAGSLRRGRETVGDLDLLCTARDAGKVVEFFAKLPQVERVLAAGETKATVWLKSQLQCDLRAVSPASFGAALLYFTGSKDHNVALRELALKKGFSINEYGLFRSSDVRHKRPLAGRTEAEVYAKLGLEFIPPELRENRGEIEAAAKRTLPKLVELKDIRGDFHNHTNYTDGMNTLAEMAGAASKMGWDWVALGDHSQSLRVAKGLSVNALRRTIAEVRKLQEKTPGLKLLRSMEVDILKDGALDYPDDVLEEIDVVIGSVHSAFTQTEEEMTARIVRAVSSPHIDILGHLSGRLLNRRAAYRVDAEAVLKAAAARQTAVEINGQPQRQDLTDIHARRARDLGARLAVTTDAHSMDQLKYVELAVTIARRAWLRKEDLLNTLTYKELKEWLARPRGKAVLLGPVLAAFAGAPLRAGGGPGPGGGPPAGPPGHWIDTPPDDDRPGPPPGPPPGPREDERWLEKRWEDFKRAPGVRSVLERLEALPEDPEGDLLPAGPFRRTYGRFVERFFRTLLGSEDLGLDAPQRDRLDQERYNYRVKIIRLQADMDAAGLGLRECLRQRPPDFKEARAKLEESARAFREMHLAGLDAVEKGYEVLTADQRKKAQLILGD